MTTLTEEDHPALPQVEILYEMDDCGDPDGTISCVHIEGHLDTDTAVALAHAHLIECGETEGHRFDRPKHVWTTNVPFVDEDGEEHETTWMADYSPTPHPGWTPVTVIDVDPHTYRPCAKCAWQAVRGFPIGNFADPPMRGRHGNYLWFCRDHAADVGRRIDEARKAALNPEEQQ